MTFGADRDSKGRSSGVGKRDRSGNERSFGFGNRGHSTDATSLPKTKSIPKSNSEADDETYVHIKLTKDVL